ncbi:MAG: condensation domain-containing protein, partial [Promethearchaeota archaeon]
NITLFMLLIAIFELLLWKFSNQDDFVVATSDAHRMQRDTEPLIGFFVNQELFRFKSQDNPSFCEFLKEVRKDCLSAIENHDIPFEKIIQAIGPERDLSYNPLFQVLFVLQSQQSLVASNLQEALFSKGRFHTSLNVSRLDSTVSVSEDGNSLGIYWEYSTDLFAKETIQELLTAYVSLLEQVVETPEKRISLLELPAGLKERMNHLKLKQETVLPISLHHLGYACESIETGLTHVRQLHQIIAVNDTVYDPQQDAELCLIETSAGVNLELVAGRQVKSLVERGVSLYHVGYEVDDLGKSLASFREHGAVLVSPPKPAKLFEDRRVAFMETHLGLVELIERPILRENEEQDLAAGTEDAKICIAATFTAELLQEPLEFWLEELGISAQIKFAPYNRVFQQLLDPASCLSRNQYGLNVILLRLEDFQGSVTQEESKVQANIGDLIECLQSTINKSTTPYLLVLCPGIPLGVSEEGRGELYRSLENSLVSSLQSQPGVYVLTHEEIAEYYPVKEYYDSLTDKAGHIPYTSEYITALATMIIRKYSANRRTPYKAIVLDCDNTLWEGVCGEVGPEGIQVTSSYRYLQEFMVAQHDAGMIICLCSKNA